VHSKTKVIGLGLIKTGTTTLGACLRELGYNHISNRRDLLIAFRHGDLQSLYDVCDEHDSFEDWPYPLAYRELYGRYGSGARYVLTVRSSSEVWLASLKAHCLRTHPTAHSRLLSLGYAYPHGFEAEHIALYERHNAAVKAFFQEHGVGHLLKVICWEDGHGWPELCSHLGKDVPAVQFPHLNSSAESETDTFIVAENQRRIDEQLSLLGLADPPPLRPNLPERVRRKLVRITRRRKPPGRRSTDR